MSLKQNIIVGLGLSVFVAIGSVMTASAAMIGNTNITEKVTSVLCKDTSSGVTCDLSTASGIKSVTFDSSMSAAERRSSIERELIDEGLMEPSDAGAGNNNSGGNADFGQDVNSQCTSILPPSWCSSDSGDGVVEILNLVLNIMTMGMGILATIGLVISGIQWLTARDKEDQIVKAKSRIFNIVIGIMVWGIMWLVLQWLLPGGINLEINTSS